MAEGTQFVGNELPMFDGINSGYGCAFTGRSLIWFHLWSLRNPNADLDTFDLAFLHQSQPDIRLILPEIYWKEVEDWEIEWIEMRARLLQQPEATKSKPSSKQEIRATSTEIQGKKKAQPDSYQEEQDHHRENGGISNSVGTDSISIEKANTSGDWSTDKNGAEDDAIMKRKVEPPDLEVTDVDARWRSSDRRRGNGAEDSRKIDGGFRRFCPIVSRSPPLMAAVFPWDRGKGPHGTSSEGRAATTVGRREEARVMDGVVTAVVEKKRLSKEGPTTTSMTGDGGASQRGLKVKGEVARMATSAAGGWREDDEKEGKEFVLAEEKTHSSAGAIGNGGASWRGSNGSVVSLLLVVCINERLRLMEPPFKLQQALMRVEMLNPLQVWLGSEVFQAQGPLTWSHIGTWSKKKEFDDYSYGYDYGGGNIWEMEEEQRLGGGRLL
ncbi:hypothetical protein PIB30_080787 [Stylosanthes scabra]|uniref:Uncharacterized protein n=1 Tax=Stylosanthes scabra TaxID=79078 RepID=A0ABU6XRA7_9FABA|nr:hypothetical protein [Stylosanthes scabra]